MSGRWCGGAPALGHRRTTPLPRSSRVRPHRRPEVTWELQVSGMFGVASGLNVLWLRRAEKDRENKEAPMRAGELMTAFPATVTSQAPVAEALDLMRDMDIRHLPVVDGGALIGMLSDRDLAYL